MLRLVRNRPSKPDSPDMLAGLAAAAGRGDVDATRTLLITVGPHLLRVVRKVLGAAHPDVEDVVQESAFAVVDALPRYRAESTVLHFVCRIGVLTALRTRRRDAARKRQAARDDDALVESLPSEGNAPDAESFARAAAAAVRELIDTLPEEQAEALALHTVLGHTVGEVAELCGAPLETVRSRLRLAKQALRARIESDERLLSLVEVSR